MSPEQAVAEAQRGALRPVYLLLGEERLLAQEALTALRAAARAGGIAGLNEEQLDAAEVTVDAALAAARTLPMMAKRRLVEVRDVERWEDAGKGKAPSEGKPRLGPLDRLADYVRDPAPSTVLLLRAGKLDQRRRLVTLAKQQGCVVDCAALSNQALPRWVQARVQARGQRIAPHVAELVAELAGPELGAVADAVERLSLYHEEGADITEDAVAECVVRLRPTTVWSLADAVGRRDAGQILALLSQVLGDPRDAIALVGTLAFTARQLIKFEAALRQGAAAPEAAAAAGAPPFRAAELKRSLEQLSRADLERWLELLAGVDADLKGGSRRPARAIVEHALLRWCQPKLLKTHGPLKRQGHNRRAGD